MRSIGPLRREFLRVQLERSLQTHLENEQQIRTLLNDRRVFDQWTDAIANTNQGIVDAYYENFVQIIRDHWLDILLLGIRIAMLFLSSQQPGSNNGER